MNAPLGLTLKDPAFLVLGALIPVVLWLGQRGGRPALRFSPAALLGARDAASFPGSWRVRLRWVPVGLVGLGLLAAVVALARPVDRRALPPVREGIDIVLCLDTSSSMRSNDLDERRTRLDVARDAARRFIESRPDDRIGLIAFARFPDLRCPPTLDHVALSQILRGVRTVVSDGPEDATGLGTAVVQAAQLLAGSEARSRVVILFTDGEENVALAGKPGEIAPAHAAQLCDRLDVRVYPIVAGRGRRQRDGTWVRLDTSAMEHLATTSGGAFHQARDAQSVQAVYEMIDALEKAPFEEPRFTTEDRFLPFLLAALALLLLARVLARSVLEVTP